MHIEIAQAVEFLGRLLQSNLGQDELESFKNRLNSQLQKRFANHWDPQIPNKGNGFRSISNFNAQLDPVLAETARRTTIEPAVIHAHLPRDFVLWIDPFTVSYRVGDHGNIMTLFEDRSRGRITLKADPALSKSPSNSPLMQHLQPRAPVRMSPPSSPETTKLKSHINQPSPLAKHQHRPITKENDEDEDSQSRHHLVRAN